MGSHKIKKDINIVNNKIDGLQTTIETIETINREIAAKLATNISMDNPETADPQTTTRNPMLTFQRQQLIREEEQHKAARYILDIARKRVGLKPITANHISQQARKQIKDTEINNAENAYYRKMAANEFLEKELKVTKAIITSSKLSATSEVLWIQLQTEQAAIDIQKQSAILKREARAIMYPPPEFFRAIKSVEHNCKEQRKKDKDLRYMVKLGTDNIELWTKYPQEPQYSKQPLDTYGEIEPPNLDRIRITPNFGQSPPKGRGKPHDYNILQLQTPPQIEQQQEDRTEQTQNTPQQQAPLEIEHQQAGQNEPTPNTLQHAPIQTKNQQADQMEPALKTPQAAANTAPNQNTSQTTTRTIEADQTNNKHPQTTTGQTQTRETHNGNLNIQAQDNNEQETNTNQQALQDIMAQRASKYQDIITNLQNDINKSRSILEEHTDHTNLDQNPNKQQQPTLKRTIDNNESDEALPKRINIETPTEEEMMIDDIMHSPGWLDDPTTETSQTEGQDMETSQTEEQNRDLQNLLGIMTPITPIKTRSRSQEQERQTKNTTENGNNQDKNHLAGTQRNSKASNKGKNQKPKINNKPKENKEQKQINKNKLDNELEIAISTPNK